MVPCSVVGLSFDFVLLNMLGFLSYVVYCLALYADEGVQREYRDRHHGQRNGVRWAASRHTQPHLFHPRCPARAFLHPAAFSAADPAAASMVPAHPQDAAARPVAAALVFSQHDCDFKTEDPMLCIPRPHCDGEAYHNTSLS